MEIFKNDFNFIMGVLNIFKFDVNNMEKMISDDIFFDVVILLDERWNEIVKCMLMYEVYFCFWKYM